MQITWEWLNQNWSVLGFRKQETFPSFQKHKTLEFWLSRFRVISVETLSKIGESAIFSRDGCNICFIGKNVRYIGKNVRSIGENFRMACTNTMVYNSLVFGIVKVKQIGKNFNQIISAWPPF